MKHSIHSDHIMWGCSGCEWSLKSDGSNGDQPYDLFNRHQCSNFPQKKTREDVNQAAADIYLFL